MRLLAAGAFAVVAVSGVAYGHTPDRLARPQARSAQSLSIGDVRVQRRAPGGRVRGSVAADPAGVVLEVVVQRGGRRVGHSTVTSAGTRTRFSVRLNRASRARLRRVGHLDLKVEASTSGPGTSLYTAVTARVTR